VTDFHPNREGDLVRFWSRLLGRIAIVLVLVPSAFAYEAPQLILVALAVTWSAGALSMGRYRRHILGQVEDTSTGFQSIESRLKAVERHHEGEALDLEDQYHDRLLELEERLDFTERLLARQEQKEADRYPTPA